MTDLPFRIRQETEEEKWRAETFWTKEPETLAWIDSFLPGDRFLDIGANIGVYSLYAGSRGIDTLAVEPHPGNFYALTLNTRLLNRALPVKALKACVGDTTGTVTFRCETKTAGTTGGGYTLAHGQGGPVSCYTVDELMRLWGPFDHIKIDVDGEERQIIAGMADSLAGGAFKSCLIELPLHGQNPIITQFREAGYTNMGHINFMSPHSRERRTKEGIQVENIVFTRLP